MLGYLSYLNISRFVHCPSQYICAAVLAVLLSSSSNSTYSMPGEVRVIRMANGGVIVVLSIVTCQYCSCHNVLILKVEATAVLMVRKAVAAVGRDLLMSLVVAVEDVVRMI